MARESPPIWTFFQLIMTEKVRIMCEIWGEKYDRQSPPIWTFFSFGRKSPDYVREIGG